MESGEHPVAKIFPLPGPIKLASIEVDAILRKSYLRSASSTSQLLDEGDAIVGGDSNEHLRLFLWDQRHNHTVSMSRHIRF